MESLLNDNKVAPFDARAAKAYGPIRASYKDRNRNALNKLIASHAVALGVTQVTNNEADYGNYAGLFVEKLSQEPLEANLFDPIHHFKGQLSRPAHRRWAFYIIMFQYG